MVQDLGFRVPGSEVTCLGHALYGEPMKGVAHVNYLHLTSLSGCRALVFMGCFDPIRG